MRFRKCNSNLKMNSTYLWSNYLLTGRVKEFVQYIRRLFPCEKNTKERGTIYIWVSRSKYEDENQY